MALSGVRWGRCGVLAARGEMVVLQRRRSASTVAAAAGAELPACIVAVKSEVQDLKGYSPQLPFKERIKYLRNFGISAHIDSGKTTLTERVLFYTGRIQAIHEVKGKDGVGAKMDFMELEREKGITIQSAATHTKWNNFAFNLIDTPGHVDFTIEVERALRVLDGAILVLCGVSGVQSQSITVDRQMKRYNVPRITFINKLDRKGANPWRVLDQVRDKLKFPAAAVQIPMGLEEKHMGVVDLITKEAIYFDGAHGHVLRKVPCPPEFADEMQSKRRELIETLADIDEKLGDKFIMEEEITSEDIYTCIRRATLARKFSPVFFGSALKNKGVQPLLDAICAYLPNPTQTENFANVGEGSSRDAEKQLMLVDDSKPTVALAFKLEEGRFGQLTYLRIYQGTLRKGDTILNTRTQKKVRIPRLVRMNAQEMEDVQSATAGDICAVFGVECSSGDTFMTPQGETLSMESLYVPDPVVSLAVKPDSKDQGQFSKAINRFTREDPTFRFTVDDESQERVISGMGELHLEIYVERMRREYGCNCTVGKPQVNYRETILERADFDHVLKKQTGGAGMFAGVSGYIEPNEDSDIENVFKQNVVGNNLTPNYFSSIEKGFRDCLKEGSLSGCAIEGVKFVLEDGKMHTVDSSEHAFRLASAQAFKKAFGDARPTVREPIMNMQIQVPKDAQGNLIGALSKRRAVVMGSTDIDDIIVLDCEVPLGDMFGFSTELRSLTQGKGEFSMEYLEHRLAPSSTVAKVAEEHRKRLEAKRGKGGDNK